MSRLQTLKRHPAFRTWSLLPQMICHQAGWWACVLWMGWWGPGVMLLFLVAHLVMMRRQWRVEMGLILLSTILGIALDNALALTGCVTYVGDILVGQAPLWLVAIWAGFGATLRHSQGVLVQTLRYALFTGFIGGPLAYWGGEKLERMTVQGIGGWLAISLTWGLVLIVLFWAANRSTKDD